MARRTLVIRTAGDTKLAAAILDGMTRTIIPLDTGELMRTEAQLAVMRVRDERYWRRKIKRAHALYDARAHSSAAERVMGIWACIYLAARAAALGVVGRRETWA